MLNEEQKDFVGYMIPLLPERVRRIFLGALCKLWGRGSLKDLHELTGTSQVTISLGQRELPALKKNPREKAGVSEVSRQRKPGGGRKPVTEKYPGIEETLYKILDGNTVGNPESPICWTTKSLRNLARELEKSEGIKVSFRTLKTLLESMGFSLQQNQKYVESGKAGPDRDEQFKFIQSMSTEFIRAQQPVISVDTKKKEAIGNFKNAGSEYRPKKNPVRVNDHDFADAKVAPYGIYDVARNEGFVNVGLSADTGTFASNSIKDWWTSMGKERYPSATEIMITADGGGSNGRRNKLWKVGLQEFADETGLTVYVCHFPPGTSKWNKIEHRLFSYISKNWRGRPLETVEIVINLIAGTRTEEGLIVKCVKDERVYEKGLKVGQKEMAELNITANDWHGEWNYSISPRKDKI